MNPTTEIIKDLLERFPDAPLLTLAKKAYNENKSVFKDIETARSRIRYYRGQGSTAGNGQKYQVRDKRFIREKSYNYNPFKLPESYADSFEPFVIKESRVLIISDLHFPYQDNKAIELALNYGIQKKANCILINGDYIDFAPISRHEKDFRQRTVSQEFEAVRTFLKSVRQHFPKSRIVCKNGNHEDRWEKWLVAKAPELLDCSDFELEVLLRFGDFKINMVKNKLPIKIGKLTVLHGHELPGSTGGVNPARSTFLKTIESVLVGHFHRTSQHVEPSMNGHTHAVNSQGCLCGLKPLYMPVNKHNHGFAYCEQDKHGDYVLENLKIINGKIYK